MANLEKLKAAGVITSEDEAKLTQEQKDKIEKLSETEVQALIDGQGDPGSDSAGKPLYV